MVSALNRAFTQSMTRTQIKRRWRAEKFGDRTRCPHCDYSRKLWNLDSDQWMCPRCERKCGLLTASWIARTRFDLPEVFELLYWFELGLTDHDIADHLEVDYRRTHRFFMTLREAIASYENRTIQVLEGTVEVDESYFGAQFTNRRRSKRERLRKEGKVKRGRGAKSLKQPVFGIYERADGIVYVEPVEDVSKETLQDILRGRVTVSSTVCSDTWRSYNGLKETFEDHQTIDHGSGQYAQNDVTINGIEGFWGFAEEELRKHHGVSSDHFESYLKEKEFRWNYRFLNQETFVDKCLLCLAHKNKEDSTS